MEYNLGQTFAGELWFHVIHGPLNEDQPKYSPTPTTTLHLVEAHRDDIEVTINSAQRLIPSTDNVDDKDEHYVQIEDPEFDKLTTVKALNKWLDTTIDGMVNLVKVDSITFYFEFVATVTRKYTEVKSKVTATQLRTFIRRIWTMLTERFDSVVVYLDIPDSKPDDVIANLDPVYAFVEFLTDEVINA